VSHCGFQAHDAIAATVSVRAPKARDQRKQHREADRQSHADQDRRMDRARAADIGTGRPAYNVRRAIHIESMTRQ